MSARLDTHRVLVMPKLVEADLDRLQADRLHALQTMPFARSTSDQRKADRLVTWSCIAAAIALGFMSCAGMLPGATT